MTFGEVSEKLLNTVLTSNTSSQRIDVVFDVYRDQSIKDAERANHGPDTGISVVNSLNYRRSVDIRYNRLSIAVTTRPPDWLMRTRSVRVC